MIVFLTIRLDRHESYYIFLILQLTQLVISESGTKIMQPKAWHLYDNTDDSCRVYILFSVPVESMEVRCLFAELDTATVYEASI
jgi:hypothetical protein